MAMVAVGGEEGGHRGRGSGAPARRYRIAAGRWAAAVRQEISSRKKTTGWRKKKTLAPLD